VTSRWTSRLAVHGEPAVRTVTIDKPVVTIGRRPGHDVQIALHEVSRDHAEVVETPTGHLIRDQGSRFGTFVNGERVTERALAHGDRIEIGRGGAVLVYVVDEARARPQAAATGPADLRQVAALLDALRDMGSDRVLDEVLALVIDAAIEATGAERGFIMLAVAGDRLEMTLARGAGHIMVPAAGFATSRKIPEEVFATGQTAVVADLLEGDMAAVHTGTVALGIRHVLCAPLRLVRYVERGESPATRRNIGVLYLDSRERGRLLTPAARLTLEALASEAAIAIENARLYQEAIEKARLDQELETASRIQQALLPEAHRTGPFYDAFGASTPSRAIGGDFFDYQDLSDGRFGFALGDVTGKGPPAALLTSLVLGMLAAEALASPPPHYVIEQINRLLLARRIESRFITLFLAVLTPSGRLEYCNAAQNPPLLFSGGTMRRLETGGTLIGAFPDASYQRGEVQLADGDTLVLFSDGITEAIDAAGEDFREDGIVRAVEPRLGRSPDQILRALFDALAAFTAGVEQRDDLTAVIVRYHSPAGTGR
jgi:serine phosphatase RsbU (regulator of sigma subunit)/pSer/pThr/pTyr-binding forkhead associated (FHA) protein